MAEVGAPFVEIKNQIRDSLQVKWQTEWERCMSDKGFLSKN